MKATLLKIQKQASRMGGHFYYAFFKGEDGKSYRTCLYPQYGNFKRWEGFLTKQNVVLDNLQMKGKLIDADSFPREVKTAEASQ